MTHPCHVFVSQTCSFPWLPSELIDCGSSQVECDGLRRRSEAIAHTREELVEAARPGGEATWRGGQGGSSEAVSLGLCHIICRILHMMGSFIHQST